MTDDLAQFMRDAEAADQRPWDEDAGDCGTDYSEPYSDVHVDGGETIIAQVNNRYDRDVGNANRRHIANMDPPTTKRLLTRLERAEEALRESRSLIVEALEDEDFQHLYSQHDHMTGPALRGTLERVLDAIARAALPEEPADAG